MEEIIIDPKKNIFFLLETKRMKPTTYT